MGQILAKIAFEHEEGARIISFTDFDFFKGLGLNENKEFENWEIVIGKQIVINDTPYIVVGVYTVIHNRMWENSGEKGVSMFVEGERFPYNFELVYIVRSVES